MTPITVHVTKVDRNDDNPGLNWLVTIVGRGPFGVVVAAAEAEADAVYIAQELANLNNWSLRLAEDAKQL